jgi:ATP-dependent DNA helicase RecG
MNTSDRKRSLLQIVSGKARIVVGTHALLGDKVEFYDLGFVVVDEQHRFGVEQRETLRLKGKLPPHVLTMTATPIPRTVAVTVFGDLDISTLDQLPKGRKEIQSHVVRFEQAALVSRTWERIAEEVAAGHQAFVVCPRIDETEAEEGNELEAEPGIPMAAAETIAKNLAKMPVFANVKIGLLHGRMATEEKASVMERFTAREIDVLVSTTVIEVGVDVPNATVMVVLDADRFGVSQLHQLRGRVGRGGHAGLCLLLTTAEEGSLALERVRAVASTLDGFRLSEIDLELRGEGDVLGANQSGTRSSLKLLRVIHDADLIGRMREAASKVLTEDPTLEKHRALAETLDRLDEAAKANIAKG